MITWYRSAFKITKNIYKNLNPLNYTDEELLKPIEEKSDKTWCAIGQFKSDSTVLHGIGIIVYNIGSIKEGHWVNDALEGYGIHIMSNGKYYEGNFKEGKYHGFGTITQEDGSKIYE